VIGSRIRRALIVLLVILSLPITVPLRWLTRREQEQLARSGPPVVGRFTPSADIPQPEGPRVSRAERRRQAKALAKRITLA
jgi:hypothetical protein